MLGFFLGVKAASAIALLTIHHSFVTESGSDSQLLHNFYYFYSYWISYFAGCIVLFFGLQELFRHITASLPGLSKLGIICFRWAALVSLVVAFASSVTSLSQMAQQLSLSSVFTGIGIAFCVLELCLLAFLLVCLRALRHTMHSRIFGLCLGLGILAATDMTSFALHDSSVYSLLNEISAAATMVALLIILAYLVLPEPVKTPVTLPITSPLLHWNDLAQALGHIEEPATGQNGFLQDVEGVVDRVLAKNSMNSVS